MKVTTEEDYKSGKRKKGPSYIVACQHYDSISRSLRRLLIQSARSFPTLKFETLEDYNSFQVKTTGNL